MATEEHPAEILTALGPERVGELVAELSDDDAVDLIRHLPPEEQARIGASLPRLEAGTLRKLLQYPRSRRAGS